METISVERPKTKMIIRKIGSQVDLDLVNRNCEHVVDVDYVGDLFCTQCEWKVDPQKVIKHLIRAVTGMGSARESVKRALGWR